MNTRTKTATMELTEFEWKIVVIALNDSSIMPFTSRELAEKLAELVAVQTK
jgi:hypothetical protein